MLLNKHYSRFFNKLRRNTKLNTYVRNYCDNTKVEELEVAFSNG